MATFKISQDKENLVQLHHKKDMATQKQRSVLGILDANKAGEKVEKGPQKPVFGVRNENVFSGTCVTQQQNRRNFFVPVAQFEAFKVYEDSPEQSAIIPKTEDGEMDIVVQGVQTVPVVKEDTEKKAAFNISDLKLPQKLLNESNFEDSCHSSDRLRKLEEDEYQIDIYKYMRQVELVNRPKPGYMKKQPDISHNMRTILVDWLVEVSEEYKLQTETLYLAINFIDRFLSYMSVVRAKLQLVGTAAMYIAAKYEEIMPPDISEFVYITDDTYTRRQVIRMEHLILKVLHFDLTTPSPLSFINIMATFNKEVTQKETCLAMYICELGILEADPFLEFLPSILAASAISLARHTLRVEEVWPQSFVETTGIKLYYLKRCILFLEIMFKKAPNMHQKSIQEKYKSQKFLHVSRITPREENIVIPERVQQNGNTSLTELRSN